MSDPVIVAKDVTVRFRPYADKTPTARRSLGRLRHRVQRTVVALDSVSCTIRHGEAVGVVGPNGAGKSTLLRVLAGTLRPDQGVVEFYGEPPALLQLGLGFNGKLSGRDNVLLGGLVNGISRSKMQSVMPDVLEFAGLGDAIDRPVNTYSTGMRSRLAFAIATTLEPEVLMLDELLAVGDAEFRAKSLAAMQDLLDRAGTVVMVSHSLQRVKQFCDSAIWLDRGKVVMSGPADEVIDAYSGVDESDAEEAGDDDAQWNAKRRAGVVKRLLAGETIAGLSAEYEIDSSEIADWRRRFLQGGRRALRPGLDADDDE